MRREENLTQSLLCGSRSAMTSRPRNSKHSDFWRARRACAKRTILCDAVAEAKLCTWNMSKEVVTKLQNQSAKSFA